MAYTYPQTPVLSKIKIGNDVKFLKDDDVRKILDTFNNAVVTNEIGTVDGNDGKFVTAANIKAYVDQAVAVGIQIVVDTQAQDKEEPATPASATTLGKLYFVELAGTTSGTYTEFITLDKGAEANPRYVWEKIGTTDVDLSDYYTKTEIDTALALKEDKANLKALAYKDNASGTLTVVTGGTISYDKANAASFTATAQNIEVSGPANEYTAQQTYIKIDTYGKSGEYLTSVVPSYSADLNEDAITLTVSGGTVSQGSAATVDPSFLNQGSFPTLSAAQTATFATSGVVASIDPTDSEMLVFSAASTDTAVTAQGTLSGGVLPSLNLNAFDGGTPTQVTLPDTATIDAYSVVTGITGDTAVDVLKNVALATDSIGSDDMVQVATNVVPTTITATFTGTFTPEGSVSITGYTPTTATLSTTTDTATVTVQ